MEQYEIQKLKELENWIDTQETRVELADKVTLKADIFRNILYIMRSGINANHNLLNFQGKIGSRIIMDMAQNINQLNGK